MHACGLAATECCLCRVPLALTVADSGPGPSMATPSKSVLGAGSKNYSMCVTKVTKAEKHLSGGKVEFSALEVIYVELKPSTANVLYIQSYIQKKWGEDYVIVGNDGVKICDSSATRG